MTFFTDLFFRLIACIISISAAINSSGATGFDLLTAAYKGFTRSYTVEERSDMAAQWLLANDNSKFESGTNEAAKEIIYAVLIQFMSGNAESSAVTDVLDALPQSDIEHDFVPGGGVLSNETIDALQAAISSSSAVPEALKPFLTMVTGGINDLYIYLQPTEFEGVSHIMGSYVADDGEIITVMTGAYYDKNTGVIYGKDSNGILGIGYDYDARQYMLQCPINCWMRGMGYNIGYDILGEMLFMSCDTQRIKFEYDGKNYMLQIWKGNYTQLTNGAEIGLYYLEDGKYVQYTCAGDDDLLNMSMELSHDGDVLFTREMTEHWWLCGFQEGPSFDSGELVMNSTVVFKTDEMADAFCSAAAKADGLTASRNGSTVEFTWK